MTAVFGFTINLRKTIAGGFMHTSSLRNNIDSIIAAMIGFAIIFLFTRHSGIGLCPDGVVYTTTAKNLVTNYRLVDFRNYPMIEFPAFYPSFLGLLILITGLQPLAFGAILNAILFGITIYLSGYITSKFTNKKWYKAAILTCVVLSPALLEVYSMMWSETLFIIWILLFVISANKYLASHSLKSLLITAIIASFAAVTRYAGITIIVTGFLLLAFDNISFRQKIKNIIIYSLITPLLLIINLIRNYLTGGTITGLRENSLKALAVNLHDMGSVFYDWLPFFNQRYNYAAILAIIIVAVLFFLFIREFFIKKKISSIQNIPLLFALIYLFFMIIASTISRFETLNSRFISPAFIPLLWSFSDWLVLSHNSKSHRKKILMIITGIIFFGCFQYGQLAADYETWDGVKDAGIPGYTEDQWQYSPTVLFMEKDSLPFLKDHTIYSNAYDAVYFFTKRPGKFLPHYENKTAVQSFLNDTRCYVIWFDDGENPDLVGKNFILNAKKMRLVKEFDDGAIYEQE